MTIHPLAINSSGGSELQQDLLYSSLPRDLLAEFQIFISRVSTALDESKLRLLYLHDLPEPSLAAVLGDGNWRRFHRCIFVSQWQMNKFITEFHIPSSKCVVITNAIIPIDMPDDFDAHKGNGITKLAYFSNPIKGLEILLPVFIELAKQREDIELHIFSSFKLYGWKDDMGDEELKPLYDLCRNHPRIHYSPFLSNDALREKMRGYHILALPSTFPETSCRSLMEAMSANMACVHPNLGALPETAANWSFMYQWHEEPYEHANIFYETLDSVISQIHLDGMMARLVDQKAYADRLYNWNYIKFRWETLLMSLLNEDRRMH